MTARLLKYGSQCKMQKYDEKKRNSTAQDCTSSTTDGRQLASSLLIPAYLKVLPVGTIPLFLF